LQDYEPLHDIEAVSQWEFTWAYSKKNEPIDLEAYIEANPLLCTCGRRMRIVSLITDPRVVDRILPHRQSGRGKAQDPFDPRAPPAAVEGSLQ
jgi:hypothetical protein